LFAPLAQLDRAVGYGRWDYTIRTKCD